MNVKASKLTVSCWTKLVRVQTLVLNEINNSLKESGLPPLAWYDVLLELDRVGRTGLRQYEIGDKILLPKHNLSRLIDRLETEGLVERHTCPEDGRGNRVRLTPAGAALRKTMWPLYATNLVSSIEQKLTPAKLEELDGILNVLLDEQKGNEV